MFEDGGYFWVEKKMGSSVGPLGQWPHRVDQRESHVKGVNDVGRCALHFS